MDSAGSAWELIHEQDVVGAKASSKAPASNKIVHSRKPVTLVPESVAIQDEPQGAPLAKRTKDERSALGWSRTQLVQNWGVPTLVQGNTWMYRKGASCTSLVMEQGMVRSSKPGC